MIPVRSSNLHAHDYDPVAQRYSVRFNCGACAGLGCPKCKHEGHTGQVYDFEGVPPEKWELVRDAESKGAAFNQHIKNWKHPETKQGFKFTKRLA